MKFTGVLAFAGLAAAAPAKVARQDGEMHILPIDEPVGQSPAPNPKKGIAFNPDADWAPQSGLAKASAWGYAWDDLIQGNAGINVVVPMCWGLESKDLATGEVRNRCRVEEIANQIDGREDKWVLGFNEPDFVQGEGGSNLNPQAAYALWRERMLPLKKDHHAQLICPGISSRESLKEESTGHASGLPWLDQFVQAAVQDAGTPDALECEAQAIHWYGLKGVGTASDRAEDFKDYLRRAHEHVDQLFGKKLPLWVTEYGPEPGDEVDRGLLAEFLTIVIPWMNDQPWIARHSAFKAKLMVTNGALNEAGHAYINA